MPKHAHLAYRCPDCGTLIYGLIGEFALSASMLRLKCDCGKSILDINVTADKKLKISVPCIICKENHSYIISPDIIFSRKLFLLSCPYSGMEICFAGDREKVDEYAKENEKKIAKLVSDMGLEAIDDLQPIDMADEEILPDATVYDLIRFIVKDLEAESNIDCPCHSGNYDLRFAPGGIEVYCENCGASYLFICESAAAAEEYINISKVILK